MDNVTIYERKAAIVYRKLNGKAMLVPLMVNSMDNGQRIFEKMKDQQHGLLRSDGHLHRLTALFTRLEVAIAEIKWTLTDTKGRWNGKTRVDLERYEKNSLFTEAMQNPCLLANEAAFILKHENLSLERSEEIQDLTGQQVLVVDTVGDKGKMAWLMLLFLVLSPAMGLIVGKSSQRADVGVA
ncbi:MAG: hypothetical protein Q9218_007992, partial [Villophora microphyllina]